MVFQSDKNLGPGIIEIYIYIKKALKHLLSPSYKQLTQEEVKTEQEYISKEINEITMDIEEKS